MGFNDGCAITDSGTFCWGNNVRGTLGFSAGPDDISPATLLISAGVPSLLAMGHSIQVAAYGTNSVCPWGTSFVKAGGGDTIYPQAQEQCFSLGANIAQLALGHFTTCVRLVTGTVNCWGLNHLGQIGTETAGSSVEPPGLPVPSLDAADIAAGSGFVCAIPSGDPRSIVCWGNGSSAMRAINPGLMTGLRVTRLGSGEKAYAVCGIISDGSLRCWDQFGTPQSVPVTW